MPDASSDEPLERSAQPEADAEPEHQEPFGVAKLAALREKFNSAAGLEDRLWAALDRLVGLLEVKLGELEASDVPAYVGDATGEAEAVRNIAETLDRLGLLKPPPPPVEAPEPNTSEVWVAASEAGLSTEQADELVARLRERYEGRA
jgi:hypothetical protein